MAASAPSSSDKTWTLDDLDVSSDIGCGASASVRLATAKAAPTSGIATRYALKVVEKAKIVGQAQLTRLFREKELLGQLQHEGIVAFHGTFKDDEHLYFLLELLPGGELLWHMRQERRFRVPQASTRLCLSALLLPLRFMEEQRVIYRDLKPTNIMFTAAGR